MRLIYIPSMKEEILQKNALEYYKSGEDELSKGRNNSAVVLFFNLLLLKKTGKVPSSHRKRFSILKGNYPNLYDIADKDFPFYQDSYIKVMSKELAEVIQSDAKFIAEKCNIKI